MSTWVQSILLVILRYFFLSYILSAGLLVMECFYILVLLLLKNKILSTSFTTVDFNQYKFKFKDYLGKCGMMMTRTYFERIIRHFTHTFFNCSTIEDSRGCHRPTTGPSPANWTDSQSKCASPNLPKTGCQLWARACTHLIFLLQRLHLNHNKMMTWGHSFCYTQFYFCINQQSFFVVWVY